MTLRSLKSLRTTPPRLILATAISLVAGAAWGQVPSTRPPGAPLPPARDPQFAPPASGSVGRTMTFQKPAGDDTPQAEPPRSSPVGPDGRGRGQAAPGTGLRAGETATGPRALTGFTGAVNRDTAFRLQGDAELNKRIVNELVKEAGERTTETDGRKPTASDYEFPKVQLVAPEGTQYVPKTATYPPSSLLIDPTYVTHRRLYFEDRNTERHGWDLGLVQTVLSTGTFYKDVFLFPAYFASHPHEHYDTSAGKCRPGDPTPYYLYPPEIDIWGYTAQASTLVGAGFIFPY